MNAPSQVSYRRRSLPALLVAAAVLIRVLVILTGERHSDMELYREWGVKSNLYGVASAYEPKAHYHRAVYPPLSVFLLWLMDNAGNALKRVFGPFDAFYFLYKSFMLAVDILTGFLLFRRWRGSRDGPARRLVLYALNPGIIVCGMLWGQLDNLYGLFIVLSLSALADGKPLRSGAWFGAVCLTKLQAPVFLPLLLLAAFRDGRFRGAARFLAPLAAIYAAACVPFLLHGSGRTLAMLYLGSNEFHPFLSANAFNLWWLLSGGDGFRTDGAPLFVIASPPLAGWALFACAYALAGFRLMRDRGPHALFAAAAYVTFAFFMLPTQMHERYLFPFFLTALLSGEWNRDRERFYGAVSVLFFVNVFLVFAAHRQYPLAADPAFFRAVSVTVSALLAAAFGFLTVRTAGRGFQG